MDLPGPQPPAAPPAPAPPPAPTPEGRCGFKSQQPEDRDQDQDQTFMGEWSGELPAPGESEPGSVCMSLPALLPSMQLEEPLRPPARPLGPLLRPGGHLAYRLLRILGGIYGAPAIGSRCARCLLGLWKWATVAYAAAIPAANAALLAGEPGMRSYTNAVTAVSAAARAVALWALQRQGWRHLTARDGTTSAAACAYYRLGLCSWLQRAVWVLPLLVLLAMGSSVLLTVSRFWSDTWMPMLILSAHSFLENVPFICSSVAVFGAVDGARVHVSEAGRRALAGLSLTDEQSCARLGPCWLALARDLRQHTLQLRAPVLASLLALGLTALTTGLDLWLIIGPSRRHRNMLFPFCIAFASFSVWSSLLLVLVKALVSVNEAARSKLLQPLSRRLEDLAALDDAREVRGVDQVQAALMLMSCQPLGWFLGDDLAMTPAIFKAVAGSVHATGGAKLVALSVWLYH